MKTNTGTVVAVVVIAAIVLYLVMNRTQKVTPQKQAGSTSTFGGLLQLAAPVISAIGGKVMAPSSSGTTSYFGQGDTLGQASYGLSHGVVEQDGNQLIDLNTGNALVFGAE